MPRRGLLIILTFLLISAPLCNAASAASVVRENLDYQVSLGPWNDVARVHLTLKELGPDRYQAEFSGAAQGMWRLLNRWLPERFQTEMIYRDGRLQPLVYQEKFINQGQQIVKEYRFDYQRRRLTLWRQADGKARVKKWEVPLTEPVYDLLSLVYNVRLGAFGPLLGGSSLRVAVLSGRKPQEMVFRIGPVTEGGRKVMLNVRQPRSATVDHYFIYLNPEHVPTMAWTRVTLFGKLMGRLLNPGAIKPKGLLALNPSPAPVLEARH
ncbi:MAG TPA: DUF3108 domain-containing protein [Desulfobaccales bacterium]|nr:DUF3108 domain-containing protein [Desulfobaccales bacterium]